MAMTVRDAGEEWLVDRENRGRTASTLEQYRYCLDHFTTYLSGVIDHEPTLADVDRTVLRGFGPYLRGRTIVSPASPRKRLAGASLAISTQASILRAVKGFLAWCGDDDVGYMTAIGWPSGLIPTIPRNPRSLIAGDELEKLLRAVDRTEEAPASGLDWAYTARARAILSTFLDTGMRVSELANLDMADYDRRLGRLHIRHSKADHSRYAHLSPDARLALDAWLRRPRQKMLEGRSYDLWKAGLDQGDLDIRVANDPTAGRRALGPLSDAEIEPAIFLDKIGKRMTAQGVRLWLRRLQKRAGLAGTYSPHDLRRLYITSAARSGMPLTQLMDAVGHRQLATTQKYALHDEEAVRVAMIEHSPLAAATRARRGRR